MPALFIGHGNPMNALEDNRYTQVWRELGTTLRHTNPPRAILAISAHWYINATAVTAMTKPATIHDFGGFPQPLFEYQYPAPGDPALAARVQSLLSPLQAIADTESWGLDHGTWSVLAQMFPAANVPVVQLSIDATQSGDFHYQLGKKLATLRDEGVLILGSGNIVHNLRMATWGVDAGHFPWAERIEQRIKMLVEQGDHPSLIDYLAIDPDMRLAAPTPEHYLPLLYVLGAQRPQDKIHITLQGIEFASASMLTVCLGMP